MTDISLTRPVHKVSLTQEIDIATLVKMYAYFVNAVSNGDDFMAVWHGERVRSTADCLGVRPTMIDSLFLIDLDAAKRRQAQSGKDWRAMMDQLKAEEGI